MNVRQAAEVAEWVKVPAAKPDVMSSIQEPTCWEERTDSHSCPLTSIAVLQKAHRHLYTHSKCRHVCMHAHTHTHKCGL